MVNGQHERHRSTMVTLLLLCVLFCGIAYLTAIRFPVASGFPSQTAAVTPPPCTVEFDRFTALWERTPDKERLQVSLRLRTRTAEELPCYIFVLARNDHAEPKVWAIWPSQAPGRAVTSAGYFHGADPHAGHEVTLTRHWQRINATLPHAPGSLVYETVLVYVVGENGQVYLARPFRL